ncbi:hypothetical protein IWQ60_011474 [Tieghemiomyces parasiticus]|uniref:Peptide hydrolase n=1 Tax=Tieghemiomyces parasiticus TaxID=78921 RepID=A0A9W7ZRW3_9FUNG|nr:hypothetical protein IWQ60_011474 [Tieghemiomyces parasiticus]
MTRMLSLLCVAGLLAAAGTLAHPQPLPVPRTHSNTHRLIQTHSTDAGSWMTEGEVLDLVRTGTKFMDVTESSPVARTSIPQKPQRLLANDQGSVARYPQSLNQQDIVREINELVTVDTIDDFLVNFTAFPNRYCKSPHGVNSSNWLYTQVRQFTMKHRGNLNIQLRQITHSSIPQRSLVARIQGTSFNNTLSNETIVIGAHQDSISLVDPMNGEAPGADDDGSGTASVWAAYQAILKSQYRPHRTLEFHWYAGEEIGLVGSADVVQQFVWQRTPVVAMMQLDMTGFTDGTKDIGLITDNTDPDLNVFTRRVIQEYTDYIATDCVCGYACSDHASWSKAGFPATTPFESSKMKSNTNIHSLNDTLATISFERVLGFAKIAIGFAVELSQVE